MPNWWIYAGFKVDIGQEHSIAQTYCKRIYVNDPYKPGDYGQITLLAHELIHSSVSNLMVQQSLIPLF